jgi:hypothetical protein
MASKADCTSFLPRAALPRGLMPDALRISRLVHEGLFHRFPVSFHHRQVGAHGAFGTPAPLLPFLERARTDDVAQGPPSGPALPLDCVGRPTNTGNISVTASYPWPPLAC